MSVIRNNLLLTDDGYNISRSVRLRSSASAYFNRTPASAGSLTTWTWSAWVKRGTLGSAGFVFGAGTVSSNDTGLYFETDNTLIYSKRGSINLQTSQVFRDTSAWYHVVVVLDSTQGTSSNRLKMYVNGVQVTSFATATYPTSSETTQWNNSTASYIGRRGDGVYFDGYLTEINFIDGQALTPSSFGETDSITGVWKPKKYTGTYGTNGFFLNFSDNSSNTATTIGKDSSGNGNNWTPNNISVTSGVTYDSMLDVPTMWADGGNGRGNYCTLSPLDYVTATPTNGNLTLTNGFARGTMAIPSTGKWYWENTIGSSSNNACGLSPASSSVTEANGSSGFYAYYIGGTKYTAGSSSAYGASWTNGDVIGVAVDADAGTVTFYKNNTSQGIAFSGLSFASPWLPLVRPITSATTDVNFGQRPFAYTPPTGFKALNTQNLPDATIKKGNAYFDATTYTGNGSSLTVTNSGSMQPDLLWYKDRTAVSDHRLFDSVRGVTKALYSDDTLAEATEASALTSFNSNGFTVGSGSGNTNTRSFIGWQWKESVSAGFDIVTYTGTGANRTVTHSLGVAPAMIIVKRRDSGPSSWTVWHSSFSSIEYIYLNLTNAKSSSSGATVWNSATPTSSVFSLGTYSDVNASGGTHVAYLFAEVAGFSKFGSYTGNGSADGPFLYLGFRPRFILLKRTDSIGNWTMYDSARNTYNAGSYPLYPNLSNAEDASTDHFDWLSNGFKMKSTNQNTSSGTYIYAAFAENPFKNSLAR